jgi:spermidine/putrescine transport system ATP-binding protein
MNLGRIEQVGSGDDVYNAPDTPFVATFVGEQNVLRGKVVGRENGYACIDTPLGKVFGVDAQGLADGTDAMLFVRPERMRISTGGEGIANRIESKVERRDLEGPFVNIFVRAGDHSLSLHLTNSGTAGLEFSGIQTVGFDNGDAVVMPAGELASE